MTNNQNTDSIQTLGLTRRFGNLIAVNGIDLAIKEGELFSILGHNGAGKTTTIKMLCCLLRPTSGTATVLGFDIIKSATDVKQRINVSPQETAVAPHLSAIENLEMMGRIYGLSKSEARRRSGALIELMKLSEMGARRVKTFSGGMQRRLSIAMALVSDPQVLFLDEPTIGLDPQARRELWEEIKKLKRKKTIILTTHYLEEADYLSDRIAIMNKGNIVALGTPTRLKQDLCENQTMVIQADEIPEESILCIKSQYPDTKLVDGGLEVTAPNLNFESIVKCLHVHGVRIRWLTMNEPSLEDVYLSQAKEA